MIRLTKYGQLSLVQRDAEPGREDEDREMLQLLIEALMNGPAELDDEPEQVADEGDDPDPSVIPPVTGLALPET
jgi:hypothetical protein